MPSNQKNIRILFFRIIIAVSCFILTWIFIGNAIQEKNMFFNIVGGILCLLAGAVSIGKPIIGLLAEPSGMLFNPRDPSGGQQPMYSIPKAKRKKGLYEEAFSEYRKITEQFPDEVKPYLEMMDIAVYNLKDNAQAENIYKEAMSVFRDENKRKKIKQAFNEITNT